MALIGGKMNVLYKSPITKKKFQKIYKRQTIKFILSSLFSGYYEKEIEFVNCWEGTALYFRKRYICFRSRHSKLWSFAPYFGD